MLTSLLAELSVSNSAALLPPHFNKRLSPRSIETTNYTVKNDIHPSRLPLWFSTKRGCADRLDCVSTHRLSISSPVTLIILADMNKGADRCAITGQTHMDTYIYEELISSYNLI